MPELEIGETVTLVHPKLPTMTGEVLDFHGSPIVRTGRGTRYWSVFEGLGWSIADRVGADE